VNKVQKVLSAAKQAFLAAALVAAAGGAQAMSSTGETRAQASIDFKIVIPVILRVKAVSQQAQLSVTEADVARGYVEVEQGTSLVLTSNNRAGFGISIAFDGGLLSRVVARMNGQDVETGSSGGSLHVEAGKLIEAPIKVGYRLYLAPGTQVGTYHWPVALSFATTA
jgi:hypothetical protein